MLQPIEQLHIISTKNNLELAPEKKLFSCFLKSKLPDMKLVTILLNTYIPKMQLFKKSFTCWKSCFDEFHWRTQYLHEICRKTPH